MEVVRVLFLLTLGVACCYGATHKCNTGNNDADTENAACPAVTVSGVEKNQCKQPVFTEYTTTGFSAALYGCDACSGNGDEAAGKCTTCDNNPLTTACNVRVETDTFKCYSYAYSDDDSKWSKGAESTCIKKTASGVKCQQPGSEAVKTDFTALSGCGPCSDDDEQKCKTCDDKALCNSSAVVSISVLLTGIAALLHLM